jgi:rRNA maturation endonuclease Nob1
MTTRIYHGELDPRQIANNLSAAFHRGNYRVQQIGDKNNLAVQIATRPGRSSGGPTAMTATISKVSDGLSITLGKQNWFGLAASLGLTALSAVRNPLSLINRLDDLAQDVESITLEDQIWQVIDLTARQYGTGQSLSERLSRTVCPYCLTANEIAAGRCLACGAPLGEVQPATCPNCGFVVRRDEKICPNCNNRLR